MQIWLMSLQDAICRELETLDGGARFREDAWSRPQGGGGRTRILRDGALFDQAGIGFSQVEGATAGERERAPARTCRPGLARDGRVAGGTPRATRTPADHAHERAPVPPRWASVRPGGSVAAST
ncbi:MAG: coproporphyrinogen III oxidase [Xanthomonadales bacterium]|nr:coproporphyrinogen III oxidase [Xanthomonadales bacterium]